jgi:ABC-type multidrug transport system fused ATPase/permease subunit
MKYDIKQQLCTPEVSIIKLLKIVAGETNRLSSVCHADQILAFNQGMLVKQDTHQELMNKKNIYSRLVAQ